MNKKQFLKKLTKQRSKGWILLEVVLCLTLFAVVLFVLQRQSTTHWQSLQQADIQRKIEENHQKQMAMIQLIGLEAWLETTNNLSKVEYPDCQTCTGEEFKKWFQASQYILSESTTLTLSEEGAK